MARDFPAEPLVLIVPLRTTWEERWQLFDDETGDPLDLTGYEMRMQLRGNKGEGTAVLSLDSDGTSDGVVTITHEDGVIEIAVDSAVIAALSAGNAKLATRFDAELYQPGANPGDPEYVVPLLRGAVTFTSRITRPGTP